MVNKDEYGMMMDHVWRRRKTKKDSREVEEERKWPLHTRRVANKWQEMFGCERFAPAVTETKEN